MQIPAPMPRSCSRAAEHLFALSPLRRNQGSFSAGAKKNVSENILSRPRVTFYSTAWLLWVLRAAKHWTIPGYSPSRATPASLLWKSRLTKKRVNVKQNYFSGHTVLLIKHAQRFWALRTSHFLQVPIRTSGHQAQSLEIAAGSLSVLAFTGWLAVERAAGGPPVLELGGREKLLDLGRPRSCSKLC